MTQFNLSGLKKILNPSSGKRNVVDQITDRLSKSSIGLSSGDDTLNAVSASGMDAFDLTQNISELLSPACGMTEEEKQAEPHRISAPHSFDAVPTYGEALPVACQPLTAPAVRPAINCLLHSR